MSIIRDTYHIKARLAQYRTPEFAAKVERMTEGRAKEIARAVIASETAAGVIARLGVWPEKVWQTLRTIAFGVHRSCPDNVRARTIAPRRLTRQEIRQGEQLEPWLNIPRPKLREECQGGPRPCPFVSCRYHLYLDVNPETGSIKLNFPHWEVWEMKESCALDVADRGKTSLLSVGEIMNLTRERIRQIEVRALLKLKREGVLLVGEAWWVRERYADVAPRDSEAEDEKVKQEPQYYRELGQPRFYGNLGLVEKAIEQMPVGPQRDAVVEIGQGKLKPKAAVARFDGLHYTGVIALLKAVLEGRYRSSVDFPSKPRSRFATPAFAAKVRKVSWQRPQVKEIGSMAVRGLHVDVIARLMKRPATDVLAVLQAIEHGAPIPSLGPSASVRAVTEEETQLRDRNRIGESGEPIVEELLEVSVPMALRCPPALSPVAIRHPRQGQSAPVAESKPVATKALEPPPAVISAPCATYHADGTVTLSLQLDWGEEEKSEKR